MISYEEWRALWMDGYYKECCLATALWTKCSVRYYDHLVGCFAFADCCMHIGCLGDIDVVCSSAVAS
jgi:hypothetical protein